MLFIPEIVISSSPDILPMLVSILLPEPESPGATPLTLKVVTAVSPPSIFRSRVPAVRVLFVLDSVSLK